MKIVNYKTQSFLIILAATCLWHSKVGATTINAASCSQSNVQSAINSSKDGDTVQIPAGSCNWGSGVSWTNKNVAVIGAGKTNTNISCGSCFSIVSTATTSAYSKWRISSMTLSGSAPGGGTPINIWDNYGTSHSGWRIDNIKFDYPGAGSGYGIFIGGSTYGLIDHNEIKWGNGLFIIVSSQMNNESPGSTSSPQGGYLESQPLDLGTANAVYIEDNTFSSSVANGCAAYDTSSGGGRAVFRYNIVTGCTYYSHWTRSAEIGGISHEIYNNTFIGNSGYNAYPIRLEAGTGVIFNNTIQMANNYVMFDERRAGYETNGSGGFGACDGSKAWDGNAGDPSAPGWPCLGQIGRAPGKTMSQITSGSKQVSAPIYLWNNGTQAGCSSGGTCSNSTTVSIHDFGFGSSYVKATPHPNGEVDYVMNGTTPKPGYTPYTYPHPLQSGGSLVVQPPTFESGSNLRIIP